jgi:hypothetical protein
VSKRRLYPLPPGGCIPTFTFDRKTKSSEWKDMMLASVLLTPRACMSWLESTAVSRVEAVGAFV